MMSDAPFRPRRGHRFSAGLRGLLRLPGGDCACEAHDLSRSGVLLSGDIPALAPDERVDLTLKAPAGTLELRTSVRVVRHKTDSGNVEGGVAVEFVGLDDAQRETLEALIARVIEGFAPAPLEALRPGAPASHVRRALEAIPLAHRVALAGRAGPRDREFLRQDQNAAVIEALVRNPSLLPAEARAIASSPHALPSTLEAVLSDPRWNRDEEIRGQVALHPRAPIALAEKALSELKPPILRRLLRAESLNPTIREKIARQLARQH